MAAIPELLTWPSLPRCKRGWEIQTQRGGLLESAGGISAFGHLSLLNVAKSKSLGTSSVALLRESVFLGAHARCFFQDFR